MEESGELLEALGDIVAQRRADTAEEKLVAFLHDGDVEVILLVEYNFLVAGGMQFGSDWSPQPVPQGLREYQRVEYDASSVLAPDLIKLIEVGLSGDVSPRLWIGKDGTAVVRDKLLPILFNKFLGRY